WSTSCSVSASRRRRSLSGWSSVMRSRRRPMARSSRQTYGTSSPIHRSRCCERPRPELWGRRMTIAIVGVGESDQSRRSGLSASSLSRSAVDRALCDAGLEYGDVDGFVIEGLTTPRVTPIDEMARSLCLRSRPFSAQGSIAGAGIVGAPELARMAIEAGLASVVVTYFGITLGAVAGSAYAVHA